VSRQVDTLPAGYFEDKYKSDIDPWRFRSSAYECAKYDHTLEALSKPLFDRGLEVGCSIGVLTKRLATRCRTLTAIDGSQTAVTAAKALSPDNVVFHVGMLPQDFPSGQYDLILLSEVLYYFSKADLEAVANQCRRALAPGGEIVLCHWLGQSDYPLSGSEASTLFGATIVTRVPVRRIFHDDVYRLERFSGC
jgi:SAM-dependent methyltransferase